MVTRGNGGINFSYECTIIYSTTTNNEVGQGSSEKEITLYFLFFCYYFYIYLDNKLLRLQFKLN